MYSRTGVVRYVNEPRDVRPVSQRYPLRVSVLVWVKAYVASSMKRELNACTSAVGSVASRYIDRAVSLGDMLPNALWPPVRKRTIPTERPSLVDEM
jgi:hypothetical protein